MEWFSISLQKCTVYVGKMDINIKQIMKSSAETHTNLDVHIMKQLKLGASSYVIKYQRVKTLGSNLPGDPGWPPFLQLWRSRPFLFRHLNANLSKSLCTGKRKRAFFFLICQVLSEDSVLQHQRKFTLIDKVLAGKPAHHQKTPRVKGKSPG